MKTLLIVSCVIFAAAIVRGHPSPLEEEMEKFQEINKDIIQECAIEMNIPPEKVDIMIDAKSDEEDTNASCFKACLLKNMKIMEGSQIKPDALKELLEKLYPGNPEIVASRMEIMTNKCIAEVDEKTDECTLASNFAKCYTENINSNA